MDVYRVSTMLYANRRLVFYYATEPLVLMSSDCDCFVIPLCSNTILPFTWKYYRPNTALLNDDTPLSEVLVESENCPFSVCPGSGSLPPAQTTAFVVRFSPDKVIRKLKC